MSITIGPGITLGTGITISPAAGFTITSADILGAAYPIYQNTTVLGTNGVDGFENTASENWLGEGYGGYNLSSTLVTAITDYVTLQGINPLSNNGYVYNVTWGAGSSIGSGLVKFGFYNGAGTPSSAYFDIQAIDPTDTGYQTNNTNDGHSLVGTFLFPATFTIYTPLTSKNGWC